MPRGAMFCLIAWLALGFAGAASANPVLMGTINTHVQPVDPSFCATNPITELNEIIPYSRPTGELEFDIFCSAFGGFDYDSASVTLEWPAEWSFVSAELCEGTGSAAPVGNTLPLVLGVGDPANLTLLARVVLDAPGAGELDLNDPQMIIFGYWTGVYGVGARAGLRCGDCPPDPMQHRSLCVPELAPTTLQLSAEQGTATSGDFVADLNDLNHCTATFEAEADWISLEVTPPPAASSHYEVTVIADVTGLAVGTHTSWVYVDSGDCIECLEVILEVREGSPVESITWGRIKEGFR